MTWKKEQELIDSNFIQNIKLERDNLAGILHNIFEEQKEEEGAKIKTNPNVSNNTIKQLKTENGAYVTSNKEMLGEQYSFL